jgi:predicted dehydrogenase
MKTEPASNASQSASATSSIPRRDFIKTSAGLALGAAIGTSRPLTAAERTRSIGANSRIRIAQIGCGSRGKGAHLEQGILPHLAATNFEVVAIADPWKKSRDGTNASIKKAFGREAKAFISYRDLLAMDGIDAVMIASPDHQHTTHLEAAAKAGKHIYVEKPLATELDKLLRAYDAAKVAQKAGSIIQVGTQLRSFPGIVGAREVMKSGVLGKISRIEEGRNGEKPYWYQYLGRGVAEADVDWKEFLGDRKMRPFDADQYGAWYGYYDFCQGPIPQWGAHFLDTAHFIMDCGIPTSCVCIGGSLTWNDEHKFTVPDCVQATWLYPEGFMLTSSNNFGNSSGNVRKFFGTKGTLSIDNWNAPTYSAEGGPKRDGQIRGKQDVKLIQRPDHFLNWLQCMRSGETPHASIDAGFQHAIAVLMAVISYDTGRKTVYDPKKRTIRPA